VVWAVNAWSRRERRLGGGGMKLSTPFKTCRLMLKHVGKKNLRLVIRKYINVHNMLNVLNMKYNIGIPESQTIGFIFGPKSIVTRYTQF
jgi:hypothetical protein